MKSKTDGPAVNVRVGVEALSKDFVTVLLENSSVNNSREQLVLFSGGEQGLYKPWKMERHLLSG